MRLVILLVLAFCCLSFGYRPYARRIRCENSSNLLERYLALRQRDNSIFVVSGTCTTSKPLRIIKNNVCITDYNGGGFKIEATTPGIDVFQVESGTRFELRGANIEGGLVGVRLTRNADAKIYESEIFNATDGILVTGSSNLGLHNVNLTDSQARGIVLEGASSVDVTGYLRITGTGSFGVIVGGSSSLNLKENAEARVNRNGFGLQVSGSSGFNMENAALLDTSDNFLIGFSINVGASLVIFQASVSSNRNGLDGASIALGATVFVDNNASVVCSNNRRTGLRIEQGIVRANNAFAPVGPLLVANDNGRFGVEVTRRSYLDWATIATTRGVNASGNGAGNVTLDTGSAASFKSSTIDDITIGFQSFAEFAEDNDVAGITCNDGGVSRGEVDCP